MKNEKKKLPLQWYEGNDVVMMARMLLGKMLCTRIEGEVTGGIIVETEAYSGDNDRACHANGQRKTTRNKVMFESGGHAYVYLCYGIHHLFNVVTNREGRADAVLIRAIEPVEGLEIMLRRRGLNRIERRLTAGPGMLTKALGIDLRHYGARLNEQLIWIEEGQEIDPGQIVPTTRIGVGYAGDDALKPWRFYLKENKWVSRF